MILEEKLVPSNKVKLYNDFLLIFKHLVGLNIRQENNFQLTSSLKIEMMRFSAFLQ